MTVIELPSLIVTQNEELAENNDNPDTLFEKEYTAMGHLIRLVLLYYVSIQFFMFLIFLCYFGISIRAGKSHPGLSTNGHSINYVWWSFVTTTGAFSNVGLTLNSNRFAIFFIYFYIFLKKDFI